MQYFDATAILIPDSIKQRNSNVLKGAGKSFFIDERKEKMCQLIHANKGPYVENPIRSIRVTLLIKFSVNRVKWFRRARQEQFRVKRLQAKRGA